MILTDMQNQAVNQIRQWIQSGGKRFVLGGYAGTGKSTIAGELERELDNVMYLAYTGKAASVLRDKGCDANTIHSMIYTVIGEDENGEPQFGLNDESDVRKASLIIVDEYSMLPKDIIEDLEYLARKVLYLGDPFQLPPVSGQCNLEPDFVLTEVHRQALDSNILRLATLVREGGKLQHCEHDDFVFKPKRSIDRSEFLNADKIICGYNKTRRDWNDRYRKYLGRTGEPCKGDTLICLQNNHKKGLYNGMIAEIVDIEDGKWCYHMDFKTEIGIKSHKVWKCIFEGNMPKRYIPDVEKFDYGYVLSCHKSQGSEWDNVVIYNEPVGQGIDRQKWLYTAISRAKNKCILADK